MDLSTFSLDLTSFYGIATIVLGFLGAIFATRKGLMLLAGK